LPAGSFPLLPANEDISPLPPAGEEFSTRACGNVDNSVEGTVSGASCKCDSNRGTLEKNKLIDSPVFRYTIEYISPLSKSKHKKPWFPIGNQGF
jgi:hypothetical protein